MANVKIADLPVATPLDGTEKIPIVQSGTTRRTTAQDIATLSTGNVSVIESIIVAASDETTPLTIGIDKLTFRMPYALTITAVRASLTAAQTAGATFTVDINQNGTSILLTKLTIDNNEKTSTTAAVQPVILTTALTDDAEITIDIDQVGNGIARGLKIYLIGTQ